MSRTRQHFPPSQHARHWSLVILSCGWIFGKITDSRRQIEHSAPRAQSHTRATHCKRKSQHCLCSGSNYSKAILKNGWTTKRSGRISRITGVHMLFDGFPPNSCLWCCGQIVAAMWFLFCLLAPRAQFFPRFFSSSRYLFLSMSASCSISSITYVQCVCVCGRARAPNSIRKPANFNHISYFIADFLLFFMFCSHATELGWLSFLNLINSVLAAQRIRWPRRLWWAFFQLTQWCVAPRIGNVVTKPVKYKQMLSVDLNYCGTTRNCIAATVEHIFPAVRSTGNVKNIKYLDNASGIDLALVNFSSIPLNLLPTSYRMSCCNHSSNVNWSMLRDDRLLAAARNRIISQSRKFVERSPWNLGKPSKRSGNVVKKRSI